MCQTHLTAALSFVGICRKLHVASRVSLMSVETLTWNHHIHKQSAHASFCVKHVDLVINVVH